MSTEQEIFNWIAQKSRDGLLKWEVYWCRGEEAIFRTEYGDLRFEVERKDRDPGWFDWTIEEYTIDIKIAHPTNDGKKIRADEAIDKIVWDQAVLKEIWTLAKEQCFQRVFGLIMKHAQRDLFSE